MISSLLEMGQPFFSLLIYLIYLISSIYIFYILGGTIMPCSLGGISTETAVVFVCAVG